MNSKDSKSSKEIKREVLHELNLVNNDLDRIQGRMTPGQFIDDALFTPVRRNPRAIFDHLRANPIGTAFLSIGTLLLMEDDSHRTYESQVRRKTNSAIQKSRQEIQVAKQKVSSIKNKFQRDNIDTSVTGESDLGLGGELGASSFDSSMSQIKENLGKNLGELKDKVAMKVETVNSLDPMTFIAIGAGLGALTGVALPVSEKEEIFIDQKASGKLSEFSSEFQDAINRSVKVMKDEFLGKFADFDVSVFGRERPVSDSNAQL